MNEIGEIIKKVMEENECLNIQITRGTGILKNNLSVILGPKGNPTWRTIKKILDMIGYEINLRKKSEKETV